MSTRSGHRGRYSPDTEVVGRSVLRKDTQIKITGSAKYTDDDCDCGTLHAVLLASSHPHARILSIDTHKAQTAPGIRAVITGRDCPNRTGNPLEDRPVIANETVRYVGEPVAIVVADTLKQAEAAVTHIKVRYEKLPVIQSPRLSFQKSTPLLHPNLVAYEIFNGEASPVPGTNIATHIPIRKGNPSLVWAECSEIVECEISFPQSHHAAMEMHAAIAEILPDGQVSITTSTQSPYTIPENIHATFGTHPSNVRVHVPLVGGAFGGKSSTFIEPLAIAASQAVGGRKVKLRCTREQAMTTLPGHIGLEAKVRLGASEDGRFLAAEITYWFDGGAYSDRGVIVTRAAAQDCTGPYRVDHVRCDAYCMYTNHSPTTSFRGFGHPELTLVIERAIDKLAKKLKRDALGLRRQNAIRPGDTTPTQTRLTQSSVGNTDKCLERLKVLMGWRGSSTVRRGAYVIAQGISCFWKTSSTPPNASSGTIVRVNADSTVTLLSGLVEIGQGTKTALAQMVAEIFRMSVNYVHVVLEVDTYNHPEHWKTVASRGTLLAGNAAVRASQDAIRQLRHTAAEVLQCQSEDIQITDGFVLCRSRSMKIPIGALSNGYTFSSGRTVGTMVIGRGSYTIEGVTPLNPVTGEGVPGPEWTVAAQGVEIEYCPETFTYRVLRAVSVIDCGKVIHPELATGQIKGGMNMGLSLASREGYVYNKEGVILNAQLRTYPIQRYGDHPTYEVAFLKTPHLDAPWGLRGLGEHGVIGMPAALANALSNAAGVQVNQMPMTPELLWRLCGGKINGA